MPIRLPVRLRRGPPPLKLRRDTFAQQYSRRAGRRWAGRCGAEVRQRLGVALSGKRQPVGFGDGSLLVVPDASFFGEPWPIGHRRRDLLDQIVGVFEAVRLSDGEQVGAREVVTFAVD